MVPDRKGSHTSHIGAARVSEDTAFMLLGDLVETGTTQTVFTNPFDTRTEQYISGRFG